MALSTRIVMAAALCLAQGVVLADAPDWQKEGTRFIHDLDSAHYGTPDRADQVKAYEALRERAVEIGKQHPGRAEPLVWEGWALLSKGSVSRSM